MPAALEMTGLVRGYFIQLDVCRDSVAAIVGAPRVQGVEQSLAAWMDALGDVAAVDGRVDSKRRQRSGTVRRQNVEGLNESSSGAANRRIEGFGVTKNPRSTARIAF
jgi:hypothetical protein